MQVVLRTLEVLLLLGAVGLPVCILLRRGVRWQAGGHDSGLHVLLAAPGTGLAVLAVGASLVLATGAPVAGPWVIGAFWAFVVVAWTLLLTLLVRDGALPARFGLHMRWTHCLELAGLVFALGFYLWPFLLDGSLEFWHYAGTDGYFYMRIAEHFGDFGTAVDPQVGMYDAASGFLADEVSSTRNQTFVDKPGTMASLALLAKLLGLLPHQVFSPLTCASIALLYVAVIRFASAVELPRWAGVLLALFVAASVPTWFLTTHTFLGNTVSLYLFPAVLVALGEVGSAGLAIYAGVLFGGQILLFPDGSLALLAMACGRVFTRVWWALRAGQGKRVVVALLVTAATTAILTAPLGRGLLRMTMERLGDMRVRGGGAAAATAVPNLSLTGDLPAFDWVWAALNLGQLPPEPLRQEALPYAWLLGLLMAAFLVQALWSRHAGALALEVCAFLCLLGLGIAGLFQTGYELFRALAVFAFIPAAVILRQLSQGIEALAVRFAPRIATRLLIAAASAALLVSWAKNDYAQFMLGFDAHFADAQYTTSDLVARAYLPHVIGTRTVVLGTETPSYTAFTNVLILFSSVRLGVPSSFYPFVLYRLKQPDLGAQYASDLVLRNRRYGDVAVDDSTPLFMSDNFELVENDLIPFFDSATFPSLHSYPLVFLKTRNLPVVRVLGEQTEVTFFSRVPRSVRVNLKFDKQLPAPTAVPFQLDDLTSSLRLDDAGSAVSDPMSMRPGLHRLRLGPVPSRAWVSRLQIDPAAGSR